MTNTKANYKEILFERKDGVELKLYVQPGARRSELVGFHGDSLKIRIHAPPVDGKANEAVVEFVSELFNVPKSRVQIIRGDLSRQKTVTIAGCSYESALAILEAGRATSNG